MHQRGLSLALLLTLGLIWGTGYSIARFAVTHGVPPAAYSFLQSLGPAIFLSVLACFGRKQSSLVHQPVPVRYYLVSGLTGIAIPNTAMYFAAGHLPAGLLAVIVNTVPLMAWPLSLAAGFEQFSFLRLLGLGIALPGLALILFPAASLPAADAWPWVLLALVAPLSFAVCTLHVARHCPDRTSPARLAAGTLAVASLFLLPFFFLDSHPWHPHWPLALLDNLILLEMVLSSLGYLLFFALVRMAGPVYYSLTDAIVSLTGLGWGMLLFHETLPPLAGSGVAMIFTGLLLVTWHQPEGSRHAEKISAETGKVF